MTHNLISGTVIPYSGKFSRGSNFRDFRDPRPKTRNKFEHVNTFAWHEYLDSWNFSHVRFVRYSLARSDNGTASLFQTSRRCPAVSHRDLSSSVSPATIKGHGQ